MRVKGCDGMTEKIKINKKNKKYYKKISEDIKNHFFNPDSFKGIILKAISNLDGIVNSAKMFLPLALKEEAKSIEKLREDAQNMIQKLTKLKENKDLTREVFFKTLYKVEKFKDNFQRIKNTSTSKILINSYFFNIFSIFDIFLGDLLYRIYSKKINLLKSSEKKISYENILEFNSIKKLRDSLIEIELDKFIRESNLDKFKILEDKFNIKLRDFKDWNSFIECSQRRNILIHCDGKVTKQYYNNCKQYEITPENIKVGDKLVIDEKYLYKSLDIISEVVFILGQTLWRKLFVEELEEADEYLIEYQYELLILERWALCEKIGEYAFNLPRVTSDAHKRIMIINYCGALKFGNKPKHAIKILQGMDWSSCLDDLKLAKFVLLEEYEEAFELCRKIGKDGEYISKKAYLEWPIFRDFRKQDKLKEIFFEIYNEKLDEQISDNLEENIKLEIKQIKEENVKL